MMFDSKVQVAAAMPAAVVRINNSSIEASRSIVTAAEAEVTDQQAEPHHTDRKREESIIGLEVGQEVD